MNLVFRLMLAVLAVALMATDARAGGADPFTYSGPQPYTGFADSPFSPAAGFGFCNETFEDGTLDVPGVTGNGAVVGPGGNIDSVDEDDGAVDGSGTGGHSYFSGNGPAGIVFTFTEGRNHGYPTEVGIVWTDGGGGAAVTFEAFGPAGTTFGQYGPFLHADLSNNGETAEDRLYAVTNPGGISAIKISNAGGGIEVDHLQLDRCVLCGDTNIDLRLTASDALGALRTAVALDTCLLCVCDTNNNGSITASDALAILRTAVGLIQPMDCPDCIFSETTTTLPTTTTTTTTTTLVGCPAANILDNRTYNEIYTCNQKFTGQPQQCADLNVSDQIRFTHLGGGNYEVRDVPDTGFLYTGTLNCFAFDWSATEPGEYTESGAWTLNSNTTTFSGASTYVAMDGSYTGRCNETGAEVPLTPANPPLVAGCP